MCRGRSMEIASATGAAVVKPARDARMRCWFVERTRSQVRFLRLAPRDPARLEKLRWAGAAPPIRMKVAVEPSEFEGREELWLASSSRLVCGQPVSESDRAG